MFVAYSAATLCALSFALIVMRSARMPVLADWGFALLCLGMFFTAEGLFSGSECSVGTIAMRWLFNGGGVLLLIVSHFISIENKLRPK